MLPIMQAVLPRWRLRLRKMRLLARIARLARVHASAFMLGVYGQINVYGVTTKSERHKRSYWTRTADGNGIGGRKAPVPYGS